MLVLSGAAAVAALVMPTTVGVAPADAYCTGSTHQTYLAGIPAWGKEAPRYTPTCDGDNYYAGRIFDSDPGDGRYAQVRLATSSSFSGEWVQAYSGSIHGTNYSINGSYWMRVCKSGGNVCWGSAYHSGA